MTSPSASSVARASPKRSGEAIGLHPVHDIGDGLGRLAERDGQQAGRQRVERPAMAGLGGLEHPAHRADRLRSRSCRGLVEDDPAIDLLAAPLTRPSVLPSRVVVPFGSPTCPCPSRSRATAGLRSSSSIRSAWSKERSGSKRIVGATLQLDGIGQRLAEIAGGTVEGPGQGRGIAARRRAATKAVRRAQVGADAHLGHRHLDAGQRRIAQLAPRQDLDQRMAQRFADPELALARALASLSSHLDALR